MLIANINRREDSLVGPLVKGVDMASVEDALAEQTLPKECPVDLLNQVPEKEKRRQRGSIEQPTWSGAEGKSASARREA